MTKNPPRLDFRNGFFSPLARAVALAPSRFDDASALSWLQWLASNAPRLGVKADELEWCGINDYLAMQGANKLSKSDLTHYLHLNGVQVSEKTLVQSPNVGAWIPQDSSDQYKTEPKQSAKYAQYTLPGGDNYREVLLTLPAAPRKPLFLVLSRKDMSILKRADSKAEAQTWLEGHQGMLAARGAEIIERENGQATKAEYHSRHWDLPNVLAHVRINDRMDLDGKRVLFVEEVQSDWGQDGKKQGFIRESELFGLAGSARDVRKARVPAAPFVTKTEAWLNLALKRIVIMAVEGGYERVAFVSGEQSSDRYDLSSHIDEVLFERTDEGLFEIYAYGPNKDEVLREDDATACRVEECLGKELAAKIVAGLGELDDPGEWVVRVDDVVVFQDVSEQAAREYARVSAQDTKVVQESAGYRQWRRLSGLDMKMGGDGMKVFYDQILPRALNKLLPALGGDQLVTVSVKLGEDYQESGICAPGIGMQFPGQVFPAPVVRQIGFEITDKMRQAVMQGLPLFSCREKLNASRELRTQIRPRSL